jgi:hypothetical protein
MYVPMAARRNTVLATCKSVQAVVAQQRGPVGGGEHGQAAPWEWP